MTTVEQRLDQLEQEVAVLRAQDGIRRTLSQYAVGVDDQKPELLMRIFADDAVLKVPAWDVALAGKDAIVDFFNVYWGRFDNPRRYYANEVFAIDGTGEGDTAAAFMYWHVTQARDGESYLGWGTYDWGFRRAGDSWLITREVVDIRAMTTLAKGWAGPDRLEQL